MPTQYTVTVTVTVHRPPLIAHGPLSLHGLSKVVCIPWPHAPDRVCRRTCFESSVHLCWCPCVMGKTTTHLTAHASSTGPPPSLSRRLFPRPLSFCLRLWIRMMACCRGRAEAPSCHHPRLPSQPQAHRLTSKKPERVCVKGLFGSIASPARALSSGAPGSHQSFDGWRDWRENWTGN